MEKEPWESCCVLLDVDWQMQGAWLTPVVIKEENNISSVDEYSASCASVWTVQSSAQKSLAVVKTKIVLDSHADVCVIGNQWLVLHDHNRPVNVYGYDPKVGSKCVSIINVTVAYTEPETGQVVIFLIKKVIEMKSIDHHFLCPMQCQINGVMINEFPKFLSPILSETMHSLISPTQLLFLWSWTEPLVTSKWRNQLKKSIKMRAFSR